MRLYKVQVEHKGPFHDGPKVRFVYVVVPAANEQDVASEALQRAADLAVKKVRGHQGEREKWPMFVMSVMHLGDVSVWEEPTGE